MAFALQPYHGGKNQPEQVTDEYLTCTICQEPGFREPKILQCGHCFCLKCLERVWGTGPNGVIALPNGNRPTGTGTSTKRQFMETACRECGIDRVGESPTNTRCPLCNVQVPVPQGGLHSLPNYVFANAQVDRLLRRSNKFPMPAIVDPRLYNIEDYRHYGHTRTACLTISQPQWHGWNIAK